MSPKESYGAEFAYGASNINPHKSANPGLIYDIDALDYIGFCVDKDIILSCYKLLPETAVVVPKVLMEKFLI